MAKEEKPQPTASGGNDGPKSPPPVVNPQVAVQPDYTKASDGKPTLKAVPPRNDIESTKG